MAMQYSKLIFLLFFATINICSGQQTTEPVIGMTTISQINQGNSYITFPTDIGNIAPLWFEGNVAPNFFIRKNKRARLMGVLTPQIILRMYKKESFPVRTPSYIPQISIYYSAEEKSVLKGFTVFGRLAHHSNGQEGDFYLANGEVNLLSGSFSTNYFEVGLIRTDFHSRFNAHRFFKSYIEIHPPGWSLKELDGVYSKYRWHNAFSIFKLEKGGSQIEPSQATISLKADISWMFGEVNNWGALSPDRLNFKLTFFYHPKFFEEIGLFTQFFRGMDYYNMYFNHQLTMLRFGIMTEILNF